MELLRQSRDVPYVKVLTGIRRSGKSTLLMMFRDFVMMGGMPSVARLVDTPAADIISSLLHGIFTTVYVKDIEGRHEIKGAARMSNLVRYIMRNVGDVISARRSSDYLKSKGISISHVTLEDYLGYMEEAFLVDRVQRMDSKTKDYLRTFDKFYATDLGIRNTVVPYRAEEIDARGHLHNELRLRYSEVAVCMTGSRAIDFIVAYRSGLFRFRCKIADELRQLPESGTVQEVDVVVAVSAR